MAASEREQDARRLAEMQRQYQRIRPSWMGPLGKKIAETKDAIAAADRKAKGKGKP
jgi:hypothetical protein